MIKQGYIKTKERFVSKGDRFQVIQGIYKHSRALLCTKVEITLTKVLLHHDNPNVKSPQDAIDCHRVKKEFYYVEQEEIKQKLL